LQFLYRNRIVRYFIIAVTVVVLFALVGGGWYFSAIVESDGLIVENGPGEPRVMITAVGEDTITLQQLPDADTEKNIAFSAVWGVTNGSDYGQLGDVVSESDNGVVREYTSLVGELRVGESVSLERTAFPHDPLAAYGLQYEDVVIPAPLGSVGAWHIVADSEVWAVLVHGRTSNRETSLKILDDLAELEVHSLTIDYRNDVNAPASESGFYDYGTTEWEDVEAAVQYALDNGADKILLFGYSMGGGIVTNYQLRSELAGHTVGMFLDAPMLNFGRTIDKGAEERGVPGLITVFAKLFTNMRFGINWSELDFLSQAEELTVPILLVHSDSDDTVPIETSIEFAAALPSRVEFHTFIDAPHVASWNAYSDEYESLLRRFIERVR
jgi:pimeloyl-ACP methyl ester carboxylesterase